MPSIDTCQKLLALIALSFTLQSCGSSSSNTPAAVTPPPTVFDAKTNFTDVTIGSGIDFVFGIANPAQSGVEAQMGGGLAAADFDDDGDIDLYIVSGNASANALYRNEGDNQFTEIAAAWGLDKIHLGSGPSFADIDGDGDLDLFVGSIEGDQIYLFRRDGAQFVDVTPLSGLQITAENTVSAGFSDYDMDSDLDLFLSHWGNSAGADTQTLWQNNGDGTFNSASIPSDIAAQLIDQNPTIPGSVDYTFAPVFADIDSDGDPDLLFASDFETSKVFRNNGDGTFSNTTDRNTIVDRNGMGSVSGDYDNDGDIDWFVTSIFENDSFADPNIGNRLYRNRGDGTFDDVTDIAGVADGGWGWSACMQDFDNDGDLDIFHVNGWNDVDPMKSSGSDAYTEDQIRYFESQGDGTFIRASLEAGLTDSGQGRGAVCFDSDRDGDIDIVLTNNSDTSSVVMYRNDLDNGNHYLTVRLKGNGLNTAAVGARIELAIGRNTQIREITLSNHFTSQNPAEAHFGLGGATSANLSITWPDGSTTVVNDVTVDQVITISQ